MGEWPIFLGLAQSAERARSGMVWKLLLREGLIEEERVGQREGTMGETLHKQNRQLRPRDKEEERESGVRTLQTVFSYSLDH
jgi:hypothetical protein